MTAWYVGDGASVREEDEASSSPFLGWRPILLVRRTRGLGTMGRAHASMRHVQGVAGEAGRWPRRPAAAARQGAGHSSASVAGAGARRARAGRVRGGARRVRRRPGAHLRLPGHRRAQQPAADRPQREPGAGRPSALPPPRAHAPHAGQAPRVAAPGRACLSCRSARRPRGPGWQSTDVLLPQDNGP